MSGGNEAALAILFFLFCGLVISSPFLSAIAWFYEKSIGKAVALGSLTGGLSALSSYSILRSNRIISHVDIPVVFVVVITLTVVSSFIGIIAGSIGKNPVAWTATGLALTPAITAMALVTTYLNIDSYSRHLFKNSTVECDNCGSVVDIDDQFCQDCGSELAHTEKCSECQSPVSADAEFCPSCGSEL